MTARTENIAGANIFRLGAVSGLITGTSAADVVFVWRNPSASVVQRLLSLKAKWRTVAGFTAAQEVSIAAHLVMSFGAANFTGGTDLSNPASSPAFFNSGAVINSAYSYTAARSKSVLASGNVRIATTGALSQGAAPTMLSQPFCWDAFAELAAAATVPKGRADLVYVPGRDEDDKIDLGSDAGFAIKLPIALGAAGTGRLAVEVVWAER